jgi:hypothetical protein
MANTIIIRDLLLPELLRKLDQEFILKNFVNREFEGDLKKQGASVVVQVAPDITWADRAIANVGDDITATDWAFTDETLTVSQSSNINLKVKHIEDVRSNLNLRTSLAGRMAQGQAAKYDAHIITVALAGVNATNLEGSGILALTPANVYENYLLMTTALQEANVDPLKMNVICLVEPKFGALLKRANILDGTDLGLEMRKKGYIGMLDGVKIFTNNTMVGKNKALMFETGDAIHFVEQISDFDTRENPNAFSDNMLGECVYQAKVFTQNSKRLASLQYAAL